MINKNFIIIASIFSIILISGCLGLGNQGPSLPVENISTDFQPIYLNGTGSQVFGDFNWPGGLIGCEMTHQGDSNFIIHINNSTTRKLVLGPANAIGNYNNSRIFQLEAGTYYVSVVADGPWTLKIVKMKD